MDFEKIPNAKQETEDMLLDRLNALDHNDPEYKQKQAAITAQIKNLTNIDQAADVLDLQAEAQLAKFDQSPNNIDQLLEQLNKTAAEKFGDINLELEESHDTPLPTTSHEGQDDARKKETIMRNIVKAMKSIVKSTDYINGALKSNNILARPKLSAEAKNNIKLEIEALMNDSIILLTQYNPSDLNSAHETLRALTGNIADLEEIAEEKNIKLPPSF